MYEAHLSTQRSQAGEDPRVPQANVDKGRPSSDSGASGQGTPTPVGVTSDRLRRSPMAPIQSHQTYADLRSRAVRGRSGPISVGFVPQPTWLRSEVAYAVGRKVGGAVVRNRLRRRMRAVLADKAEHLPVGAYLVRCGPESPSLTFEQLKEAMTQALEKATATRRTTPNPAQ